MENETTPETKEESFGKKLTKEALISFTKSAATGAGLIVTVAILSALLKPKKSQDNNNVESIDTTDE